MTSQLDVRLGSPKPTILHLPVAVHSLAAADEAIELANAYGVCDGEPLAESEEIAVRAILGERVDGSWAASTVGLFGPRQATGKNDIIATCELSGLLLFGERLIIHTAHEFPTANESFLRLVAVFEAWDDLRRKVARIRYANGEQGIEMRTGQRLKYRARTGGSSRGFAKADRLIYDEAQHLSREHVAASGPSRLANPNSQSIYAGSGGLETSAVAWQLRRSGLAGKAPRMAYIEHTSERVTLDDSGRVVSQRPEAADRDAWYQAMPGLGRWVTEEAVEAMYDELGPDLGLRELGCVWDPEPSDLLGGNMPNWSNCGDETSVIASHHMWAIATSADRKWSTIGVAGRRADGMAHVATHYRRSGADWVVPESVAFWESHRIPVRIWKNGPENSFIAPLRECGVEVVEVSTPEMTQATGFVIDGVEAGTVRHPILSDGRLSALDRAVAAAELRTSSDGASVWSQRLSNVEITPLVAVTVALGGVPVATAEPMIYVWKGGAKP